MYDYNDYYNYGGYSGYTSAQDAVSIFSGYLAIAGILMLILAIVSVFMIVCLWKIFRKAGRNGWEAIIPIYNIVVLLQIVNLPLWYIVLYFIPFANIYAVFKTYIELAHKFGKSTGFGVAMVFFAIICLPILAFGDATYEGNSSNANYTQSAQSPVMPTQPSVASQPMSEPSMAQSPVMPTQSSVASQPMSEPSMAQSPVMPTQSSVTSQPMSEPITGSSTSAATDVKKCPNCGTQIVNDANSCFMCGHNF